MTTTDEILEVSLDEAKRIVEKEVLGQRLRARALMIFSEARIVSDDSGAALHIDE